MANWANPVNSSAIASVLGWLKDRDSSLAKMFDDGVTWTNLETGTIRWGSSNSRFEKWNGTTWVNLSTALTDVLKIANNLSDVASASTSRTNLGLGTIAVENSPLALNKGGSGATDAAGARTAFGLGTISTQAASAVTITGGTVSGLTSIGLAAGSTLGWASTNSGNIIDRVYRIQCDGDIVFRTYTSTYSFYWDINSVSKMVLSNTTLRPYSNNGIDLGDGSTYFNNAYLSNVISSTYSNASGDMAFRISGTTYWVMGATSKEFRPNTNGSQNLGHASYLWDSVYANRILAAAGLGVQFAGNNIEYLALSSGSHRFFNSGGAVELWKIDGSNGKFVPIYIGQQDYTVTGLSITRSLTATGGTVDSAARNVLGTLIADLQALGFIQ